MMEPIGGILLLNALYDKPEKSATGKAGNPGKSGKQQIIDNAEAAINSCLIVNNPIALNLGLGNCQVQLNSACGRDRPQRSIRLQLSEWSQPQKKL